MTLSEVERRVHSVISEILPVWSGRDIPGDKHLRDLGADSVDRVEIIVIAQEKLGINEPMGSFSDLPDVDALVEFLHRISMELDQRCE